jgi:predicted  nucleic acid-binding Zn-ribbon protein
MKECGNMCVIEIEDRWEYCPICGAYLYETKEK